MQIKRAEITNPLINNILTSPLDHAESIVDFRIIYHIVYYGVTIVIICFYCYATGIVGGSKRSAGDQEVETDSTHKTDL